MYCKSWDWPNHSIKLLPLAVQCNSHSTVCLGRGREPHVHQCVCTCYVWYNLEVRWDLTSISPYKIVQSPPWTFMIGIIDGIIAEEVICHFLFTSMVHVHIHVWSREFSDSFGCEGAESGLLNDSGRVLCTVCRKSLHPTHYPNKVVTICLHVALWLWVVSKDLRNGMRSYAMIL